MSTTNHADVPYVKIVEQPQSRGTRFRYECEGRNTSNIFGVNSTKSTKTYPTIELVNHNGPAFVVISCVTKNPPHYPHPHKVVQANEFSQGICHFKIPANEKRMSFKNLGIQCTKKKEWRVALQERQQMRVDPFNTGFEHKEGLDSLDVTCVRLCFQVFIEGKQPGSFNVPLRPVISEPVYDKKQAGELAICYISHASASVSGGKYMCILADKVSKDDIKVRFFDSTGWETYVETVFPHYHKQIAIVFKSPKYSVQDVNEPLTVHVELQRPSDGETSRPIPFQLLPLEVDDQQHLRRKRRKLNETPKDLVSRHLQAELEKNAMLINLAKQRNNCNLDNIFQQNLQQQRQQPQLQIQPNQQQLHQYQYQQVELEKNAMLTNLVEQGNSCNLNVISEQHPQYQYHHLQQQPQLPIHQHQQLQQQNQQPVHEYQMPILQNEQPVHQYQRPIPQNQQQLHHNLQLPQQNRQQMQQCQQQQYRHELPLLEPQQQQHSQQQLAQQPDQLLQNQLSQLQRELKPPPAHASCGFRTGQVNDPMNHSVLQKQLQVIQNIHSKSSSMSSTNCFMNNRFPMDYPSTSRQYVQNNL